MASINTNFIGGQNSSVQISLSYFSSILIQKNQRDLTKPANYSQLLIPHATNYILTIINSKIKNKKP